MLGDIFHAFDPLLHLRTVALKSLSDQKYLSEYLKMDEVSLWALASDSLPTTFKVDTPESKAMFAQTRGICRRIQTRCLYPIVGTFYVVDEKNVKMEKGDENRKQMRNEFAAKIAISDKYALHQAVSILSQVNTNLSTHKVLLVEINSFLIIVSFQKCNWYVAENGSCSFAFEIHAQFNN